MCVILPWFVARSSKNPSAAMRHYELRATNYEPRQGSEFLEHEAVISHNRKMGDSGEGLVDAEARIQEQIEERESERRRRNTAQPAIDPERIRQIESLRLARAELERQSDVTTHPVRKQQIKAAIAEIDKRIAAN